MTGDAFNAAATIANFVSSWRILCPPSVTQCFFSAYDRKLRYFSAKSHENNTPQQPFLSIFYSHRQKIFFEQEKGHKTGWRDAPFLVPAFANPC